MSLAVRQAAMGSRAVFDTFPLDTRFRCNSDVGLGPANDHKG